MKRGRLVLPPEDYKKLLKTIFLRDKYKCRCCGSRNNLHGHHLLFRSHGGDDSEENMLSLCNECHDALHDRFLLILPPEEGQPLDASRPVKFVALSGWTPGERIRRRR